MSALVRIMNMISRTMHSTPLCLIAIVLVTADLVGAATCRVPGGTSDDAPAIKAALASCNGGGTVVLDQTYTIASVLQTTALNNVTIQLSGSIKLSRGEKQSRKLDGWMLIEHRYIVLEI
jgi:hypothetical protein